MRIDRIEAKRKLSQNRNEADHAAAVAGLERTAGRGAGDIAAAMRTSAQSKSN